MKNLIYTICNKHYQPLFEIWKDSIRRVSDVDILVLCSEDFDAPSDVFTCRIDPYDYSYTTKYVINNYEKIREYDNILYLDDDILCLKPLDKIFETINQNHKVIHGVQEGSSLRHAGPFHRFMHVEQNEIAEDLVAFNAGTFGFNVNMLDSFQEFLTFMENERNSREHDPFFGEQSFFNMFFNFEKRILQPTLWEYMYLIDFGMNLHPVEDCYLIHFLGAYGDPNYKLNFMRDYKYPKYDSKCV